MKKVFIDGSAGTTGLRIYQRLGQRQDLELLTLSEERRKDPQYRQEMLNKADVAFLCLPDAAAREAVALIRNPDTTVIDTSTAHRTEPGWVYGFPELTPELKNALIEATRIAVPGCHAGGFIALVRPLIDAGILPKSARLCCHSLTGYSGGGKKMIAEYESPDRSVLLDAPRIYGLNSQHKHLKEMKALTGLEIDPIFCPIVSDFNSGMLVTVPVFAQDLNPGFGVQDIKDFFAGHYNGKLVRYVEGCDEQGLMSAGGLSGLDRMEISVFGNEERILLMARYDNLGKGASGAALECLNYKLGLDETTGLSL